MVSEMLAHCYVVVFSIEIVDMLSVYSAHHLQGLLATLDALGWDLVTMAEVSAHFLCNMVRNDLIGNHSYLFSEIDSHRLISLDSPKQQFLNDRARLYPDNSLCFFEIFHSSDK